MATEVSEATPSEPISIARCQNCGASATSNFCPNCGQSTKIAIPTLFGFLQEAFGAIFSYDHKLWRTLWVLVAHPGQLTVDYAEGKRIRYLTPFQLFFWLQAITFLSYHLFFNAEAGASDRMSRALLIIGAFIAVMFALIHVRRRMRFLLHLVASIHIWTFLMLLLLVEYAVTPTVATLLHRLHVIQGPLYTGPFVTYSAEVIMAVYTTLVIRKVYANPLWKAALKTLLLLAGYLLFVKYVPL
ncbi:MAG TPA: DUF3667 domain-containing protein [Chthonomonadaceae bacterium]|nr:DUF3667 domain-containing protein [Chthonomonadaceae bacterium]